MPDHLRLFSPSLSPPSFYLLCAFAAGIALGRSLPFLSSSSSFFIYFVPLLLFTWLAVSRIYKLTAFGLMCCAALLFGIWYIGTVINPVLPAHHIKHHTGPHKKRVTARIISFKQHFQHKIALTGASVRIMGEDGTPVPVTGKIKISLYGTGTVPAFGDIIEFKSVIRPIRNFSNPGGFDYESYMAYQGIYATAYSNLAYLTIKPTASRERPVLTRIFQTMEKHRIAFHERIGQVADNRQDAGTILTALVTGKKEAVSPDLRDLFAKAGISHLLAISGLHLSIVGVGFFFLFYRFTAGFYRPAVSGLAKKAAWLGAILPVTLYAMFSGFSPSTQRAYIMILVFFCALAGEKEKDSVSSLCTAGTGILIFDPTALFSISFQLSFAAVMFIITGLSVVGPAVRTLKRSITARFLIFLCVTFLAGLGTFPLTAHYFHTLSHVQLLTNIAAVPVIGFMVLPMGLTAFLLSGFSPPVSVFLIQVSTALIDVIISLTRYTADLPFSWSRITTFSFFEIALFYFSCAAFYFLLKKDRIKSRACLVSAGIFLSMVCTDLYQDIRGSRGDGRLRVTVLDIGQGSSSVIQTPEGKTILVDGGGFSAGSRFDTGRMVVAPFLWHNNIRKIDTVILSHPETDHMGGLVFILENFKTRQLIKNTDTKASKQYRRLMAACRNNHIPVVYPSPESPVVHIGSVSLHFFSGALVSGIDLNNNSIVFKLAYHDFSMLFPGDVLKEREHLLTAAFASSLRSDILLSPHHGSNSSSTKFFLDQVRPKSVIISCGFRNRYGFPHPQVLKRYRTSGIDIYRTDLYGAAVIETDGF